MTTSLATRFVRLLRASFRRGFPDINVVFIVDAYKVYLTKPAWESMAMAGFLYCLVPARMVPCCSRAMSEFLQV